MTNPVPYDQYDKDEIRALLDSLPLSGEGKRLAPGKVVSFVVRHEQHTQGPALVTAGIVAVQRHKVFFEPMMASANGINGGIEARRCWIDQSLAMDEYEKLMPKLNATA